MIDFQELCSFSSLDVSRVTEKLRKIALLSLCSFCFLGKTDKSYVETQIEMVIQYWEFKS